MSDDELVIDSSNFDQYFFDVRKHGPKKGQVMAVYTAMAELTDGNLKQDLIYLLSCTPKAAESVVLMQKIAFAERESALRVVKEILEDLKAGKTADDILPKSYSFKMQACYYTEKKYIPENDPHWSYMEIKNLDEYLEHVEHAPGGTITSKIVMDEKNEEKQETEDT